MIDSTECRESQSVSFGIFKPEEGCNIDDALAHMATVANLLEKTHNIHVTILRCLDFSWAAVFAAGKEEQQNEDKATSTLPEAAAFTKGLKCAVRIVDSGWFRSTPQETGKGVPFAQLSLGDIVSIRRIHCSWERQDVLSYSCLAILRSYMNSFKGMISLSFYDSLDGKQIIGLGVWDRVESALALEKYPHTNPALPYWKDMGAKKLEYNVCQVVYVTNKSSAQNSRPGFEVCVDNLQVLHREAILEVAGLVKVPSLSGKGLTPFKQCPFMDPEVEIEGGRSGRDVVNGREQETDKEEVECRRGKARSE